MATKMSRAANQHRQLQNKHSTQAQQFQQESMKKKDARTQEASQEGCPEKVGGKEREDKGKIRGYMSQAKGCKSHVLFCLLRLRSERFSFGSYVPPSGLESTDPRICSGRGRQL